MVTKKRNRPPYRKKSTRTHPKSRVKKRNSRYKTTPKRRRKRRTRKQRSPRSRGGDKSICTCECIRNGKPEVFSNQPEINANYNKAITTIIQSTWSPSKLAEHSQNQYNLGLTSSPAEIYNDIVQAIIRKFKLDYKSDSFAQVLSAFNSAVKVLPEKVRDEWNSHIVTHMEYRPTHENEEAERIRAAAEQLVANESTKVEKGALQKQLAKARTENESKDIAIANLKAQLADA